MRDRRFRFGENPPSNPSSLVVLFDPKVNHNLQFKSILTPFAQGSQVDSERPWAALEKAPWLSNGTECPGVGDGKGKAVFILAANGPESPVPTPSGMLFQAFQRTVGVSECGVAW